MFKNINWKNIGTIAVVAMIVVLTSPLWLPPAKALVARIPVIGPKLA